MNKIGNIMKVDKTFNHFLFEIVGTNLYRKNEVIIIFKQKSVRIKTGYSKNSKLITKSWQLIIATLNKNKHPQKAIKSERISKNFII